MLTLAIVAVTSLLQGESVQPPVLRPPSVPLVVHDPYFSLWSPHDRLTDGWPTHWTGREVPMCALVRVDGDKLYRLMGPEPADVPAIESLGVIVDFTATHYAFHAPEIDVGLSFTTPALPDDLDLMSRPVTYLSFSASSRDGRDHRLDFYVDVAARLCVNEPDQQVVGSHATIEGLEAVAMRSVEQPVLRKRGDDLRIDWGTAYLASGAEHGVTASYGPAAELRRAFVEKRAPRPPASGDSPRRADDGWPAASIALDGGPTEGFMLCASGARPAAATVMIAYDDEWSMRYFGERLRPYWRRDGIDGSQMLRRAWEGRESVIARCRQFDGELSKDLSTLGGDEWVQLCKLAYRQCIGANKLCADASGRPLLFPKENFSNGCVATVDVIYPMAPLFLLLSNDLAKAMVTPVLDYAASPHWKFPFAPHDLGTYPHATGQVYGGGERNETNQMPIEESANLILLVAAIVQRDGRIEFATKYWRLLTQWARYLEEKGFDPDNQLCTDDFTGHLAHNVNLSAKATLALGAYSRLARQMGAAQRADELNILAHDRAADWEAQCDEGHSTRLAFDRPGTWSQKYNLVWDDVLGLALFPAELKAREMEFYRRTQNEFGLPLDSRATFTKCDWTLWSACLTGKREDFDALVAPIFAYANRTPDRVPLCDWSDTLTAKKINMIARPVVGGFFMRALLDEPTWKKWYARGARGPFTWAPLPSLSYEPLAGTAESAPLEWRFVTSAPADGWSLPEFDDKAWKRGGAGFGTKGTPGAIVTTEWSSSDIWLRREFTLNALPPGDVELRVHHDEDAEIYINGVLAAQLGGYVTSYELEAVDPKARAALRQGRNVLAVHCRQTGGGQYVDAGLVRVIRPTKK